MGSEKFSFSACTLIFTQYQVAMRSLSKIFMYRVMQRNELRKIFSFLGIDFVKSKDERLAKSLAGIYTTPALVYFRKKIPVVYDGGIVASVTT